MRNSVEHGVTGCAIEQRIYHGDEGTKILFPNPKRSSCNTEPKMLTENLARLLLTAIAHPSNAAQENSFLRDKQLSSELQIILSVKSTTG